MNGHGAFNDSHEITTTQSFTLLFISLAAILFCASFHLDQDYVSRQAGTGQKRIVHNRSRLGTKPFSSYLPILKHLSRVLERQLNN